MCHTVWTCKSSNRSCGSLCHRAQPCISVLLFSCSWNLLGNNCATNSLVMVFFLHLCCRHITSAESVTAVSVYCVWVSCVNLVACCGDAASFMFPWIMVLQTLFAFVGHQLLSSQKQNWVCRKNKIFDFQSGCGPARQRTILSSDASFSTESCRSFDQNPLYFLSHFPSSERGRTTATATYHCFYINGVFIAYCCWILSSVSHIFVKLW